MFIRVEESKNHSELWFFNKYRYRCDRCGKEFIRSKKDVRIKYCNECQSFDERQRARAKANEKNEKIVELQKMVDHYKKAQEKLIDEIAERDCDICPLSKQCYIGAKCHEMLRKWSEEDE